MDTNQLATDLAGMHAALNADTPAFYFSIGPGGLSLLMDAKVLVFFGLSVGMIVFFRTLYQAWKATR
jgi:hypothetical protein